ncbi:hypothetical protein CL629_03345 [bacterium]|nr:hypothetical protein [bacterium]|tara:strand:- start:1059 stop:1931 length:873 start_codon:yes stop_codon:yes gene_type:complete
MKVLIIDIDSKIPNLALKKIEKYHADRGDEVIWNFPLMKNQVDKIYVSSIFNWNKHLTSEWEGLAEIGGSGWNLQKTLPKEIDDVKPIINMGFTMRGCTRKCHFCIVPEKEGKSYVVGDIYDLWDGKSKTLVLFDNNILTLPDHFKLICSQIKKEGIKVDFNQGLDIRLMTKETAELLKTIKHEEYRFAFDDLSLVKSVEKGIKILKDAKINRAFWYVYCDENFESALERLLILKRLGQRTYLMRDRRVRGIKKYNMLANWSNCLGAMAKMDFFEYIHYYKNRNYFKNED